MDEGFAAYSVRGEGLSGEVDDILSYHIITCDGNNSIAASKRIIERKVLQSTVAFTLKFRGVNVIICKLKSKISVAGSTVLVTKVLFTIISEPV